MRGKTFVRCAVLAGFVAASAAVTVAAEGDAPQVDNPAYAMWAKYKPGSSASYESQTVLPMGMKQSATMSMTLVSVAADAAKVKTAMKVAGSAKANEHERALPAKTDADKALPAPTGTEDVTVAGKAYHCKVYRFKGMGPMARDVPAGKKADEAAKNADTKLWASDEVPGGLVKMHVEMAVPQMGGGKVTTDVTLTACDVK